MKGERQRNRRSQPHDPNALVVTCWCECEMGEVSKEKVLRGETWSC